MSAYVVDAETIDAIVSGARQFGGQEGFSFARLFPNTAQNRGGYSYHRFSRYATDAEAPDTFNPNTLGRELWTENLRSIHARYPDTLDGGTIPGRIGFTEAEAIAYEYGPGSRVADVDPLGVLGAMRGYEYQSCEHDGWRSSIAHAAITALRGVIVDYLIEHTGANAWTLDDGESIEAETTFTERDNGYTIDVRRRQGPNVVSLGEMIQRGR